MSEMLGNQYFLARTFDKALVQFEEVIKKEPENEKVKKKLIICYCEVEDSCLYFSKALQQQPTDELIKSIFDIIASYSKNKH